MWRPRRLPAPEVALVVLQSACAGTTTYESSHDSEVPEASWPDADDANTDGPVVDAAMDSPAACQEAGSGLGIESCCDGELCRGTCVPPNRFAPYYQCLCGSSKCPASAVCCYYSAKPDSGSMIGPYCLAPEDCTGSQ